MIPVPAAICCYNAHVANARYWFQYAARTMNIKLNALRANGFIQNIDERRAHLNVSQALPQALLASQALPQALLSLTPTLPHALLPFTRAKRCLHAAPARDLLHFLQSRSWGSFCFFKNSLTEFLQTSQQWKLVKTFLSMRSHLKS